MTELGGIVIPSILQVRHQAEETIAIRSQGSRRFDAAEGFTPERFADRAVQFSRYLVIFNGLKVDKRLKNLYKGEENLLRGNSIRKYYS